MVNVAPWQPLDEVLSIATAPFSVFCTVPSTPAFWAGTLMVSPVWLLNETPVVVQDPWPPSGAMLALVPLSATAVTVTGKGFGLLILISASPVAPGYSVAVVLADTSTVVNACEVVALP